MTEFYVHEDLVMFSENAKTKISWDFNTAIGDTIREKNEAFVLKLMEASNVMVAKGASGKFWIVISPTALPLIETTFQYESMNSRFDTDSELTHIPMGEPDVSCHGVLNKRWKVYVDNQFPDDMILIGVEDQRHFCRMRIANFVF